MLIPKFATKLTPRIVRELSEITPPWGPCGYVTYKRTYSRLMPESGRLEEWHETVERGCNGILEIGGVFTHEQIRDLAYYWHTLKGCPAGRPIWQLGTDTVRKVGGDSMQNCFAGETEVITSEGVFPIASLIGKTVNVQVLTGDGLIWHETVFRAYGTQRLMTVTFADGSKVRATSDHEWIKYENGKASLPMHTRIFTQDLMDRQRMMVPLEYQCSRERDEDFDEGYAHGFVFGDGTELHDSCRVEIFPAKTDMVELISGYGNLTSWEIEGVTTPVVTHLPKHWKELPSEPSRSYARGFVMGLASADGSVDNRLRIHNKDRETLLTIQRLARFAGLRCHAPYLSRELSPFDGSEKPLWCVTISTHNLVKDDFIRDDQAAKLLNTRAPKSVQVIAVEYSNEEPVYCCVVPEWHNFVLANGVVTGQCWHVAVNHPIDPFTFTFNQLMLGGGVGFSIDPEYVYEIPAVKFAPHITRVDDFDCDYIATDNREGWVELLRRTLDAFFFSGRDLRYSTHCIRPAGRLIKGFGGVASGPEKLVEGIGLITDILRSRLGRKLTPTNCMDIMNIIGMIVVAGNVRRSAEIAVGSPNDAEFLEAKDWSRKIVPPWRQQSNNTVRCSDTILLPDYFWRGYSPGCGEAYGLFNDSLCRRYGRLIDEEGYRPDSLIVGPNPCGEIILESHEACNLAEQFLPNINDVTEFGKVAALLLRAAKAIGRLPFWHPKTNEVVTRNNRIGISITGYLQSDFVNDSEAFDAVYDHLEETDKVVSREMNCSRSIKLTTVKPSGTLSLLAGVTPGVHAAFSQHHIRRIGFASNDGLVEAARSNGYHVAPKINIDGSLDFGTVIVDFPVKVPYGTQCAAGYSAISQLENQLFLQKHWADNSVSCTIYYQEHELPEIREWLSEHYAHEVKTTSFLLHQEHGFVQTPYEEITAEQYAEMSSKVTPILSVFDSEERELIGSVECGSGGCPVK